jgi:hypothetical protein
MFKMKCKSVNYKLSIILDFIAQQIFDTDSLHTQYFHLLTYWVEMLLSRAEDDYLKYLSASVLELFNLIMTYFLPST